MSGTIRITRAEDLWTNRFRRFTIWINGEKAGRIRRGETLEFPVPQGPFTLRASIDWAGSPTVDGVVEDGQTRSYLVRNGANATGLVKPDTYLDLAATD